MKTFEEKWTAWLDGQLTDKELVEFEASLPDKAAAELEKQDSLKLGVLLRENLTAPAMANEEFFHHQLRQHMAADVVASARPLVETPAPQSWWSFGRILWTSAAALAILAVSAFYFLREPPSAGESIYLTQIINTRVDPVVSPNATVSVFETKEANKVTVLWVDGLQSLPSEYAAK